MRASGGVFNRRRLNDDPSVVWAASATRYVVWNGWTSGTRSDRLYLRRGSGTPIGPAIAAAIWQPSSSGVSLLALEDPSPTRMPSGSDRPRDQTISRDPMSADDDPQSTPRRSSRHAD